MRHSALKLGDKVRAKAFITSVKVLAGEPTPEVASVFLDVPGGELSGRKILLRWPALPPADTTVLTVVGSRQFRVGVYEHTGQAKQPKWKGTGTQNVVCLKVGMKPYEKEVYAVAADLELVKPELMVQIEGQLSKLDALKTAFKKEFGE